MDIYKKLCDRYLGNYYLIDLQKDDLINISGLKDFVYELSLREDDRMKSILHISSHLQV